MLEEKFLPFRYEFYPEGVTFQRGNSQAHSEIQTRDLLPIKASPMYHSRPILLM